MNGLWKDLKEASVLPFVDNSGFISIRNLKSNPDIPESALKTGSIMRKTAISDILEIEGVDTDIGLHHILGDRRKYKIILSQFVESHSAFSNGIQTALESHDIPEAISLIHSLRGASGYIGAAFLKEQAGTIEEKLRQGILPDKNSLQILLSAINSLIENITATLNTEDDNIRITVFNELEARIRNSDETLGL